jgi:hypothetical protein
MLYPINRWYLKPHHIGGWFTHGYLNDVLCLPLFLPMILYVQRVFGVRRDDDYPGWWEILQHWVIFTVVFELILPTMPRLFTHTQDPWNAVAYLAGGVIAGVFWRRTRRVTAPFLTRPLPYDSASAHPEPRGTQEEAR